jgi:hypothetical protein
MKNVDFRGDKIGLLEAKAVYELLRLGLYHPRFSEEEKLNYNKWALDNNDKDKLVLTTHRAKKEIAVPINERGYLMHNLYLELKLHYLLGDISKEDRNGFKKNNTSFHPEKFGYTI